VELRNRLANESAVTAQATRQSTDQFLAILHGSSYAGLESAAQRLSPTSPSSGQAAIRYILYRLWTLPATQGQRSKDRETLPGGAKFRPRMAF
jgi:hypothetical protein